MESVKTNTSKYLYLVAHLVLGEKQTGLPLHTKLSFKSFSVHRVCGKFHMGLFFPCHFFLYASESGWKELYFP